MRMSSRLVWDVVRRPGNHSMLAAARSQILAHRNPHCPFRWETFGNALYGEVAPGVEAVLSTEID